MKKAWILNSLWNQNISWSSKHFQFIFWIQFQQSLEKIFAKFHIKRTQLDVSKYFLSCTALIWTKVWAPPSNLNFIIILQFRNILRPYFLDKCQIYRSMPSENFIKIYSNFTELIEKYLFIKGAPKLLSTSVW